ncbi:MAG: hypothetical protein JRN10_01140 [Nitrososphaerota archaeon]|jgi:flagellin-like protein|nr:hypothetical protein [Nitrososphaerota archaeon]MDG7037489.1 hypothetical protein [Nitrososphaerota archaeon]
MFCRVQRRRKAVSEMLAALILIMIVVAGFSVLVYPQLQRYIITSQQLGHGSQTEGTNARVQISLVYAYAAQSGSATSVTTYLDSYGTSPFTPSSLIVDIPGTGTYTVASFTIMYSGNPETTIVPGQTVELQFSIPYTGAMPSAYYITAVGNSGLSLTWTA